MIEANLLLKEGVFLIDKPPKKSSFFLVSVLRRVTKIKKIGHCGTLDPFATGVMVMLVGKNYTRRSAEFMNMDKTYSATIKLGQSTDSYDIDGIITNESPLIPSLTSIEKELENFQGEVDQVPPMFSAKKVNGKKLYELARKGEEIARQPVKVQMAIQIVEYSYPYLKINVECSKGTYIRSIAHDLGEKLGSFGHLSELVRTKSGNFNLSQCITLDQINTEGFDYQTHLMQL
ncbi:MAG: tRNA pseudouridine(55) synthase TruB [Rhabdochlamydiaceae bacterium]|nr:tRNA pseudouridine(55) synthase TruB [Candidatus Amphrikana amoebophyrae]